MQDSRTPTEPKEPSFLTITPRKPPPPPPPPPPPTVLPSKYASGAFHPTEDARAAEYFHLMSKCRKCGWYSQVGQKRKTSKLVGLLPECISEDWCQGCGRVALDEFFNPPKCHPYRPEKGDLHLGTKTIPFRIKSHDPRKMYHFQPQWEKYEDRAPEWTYDAHEMDEEFFRHRVGKYPSLEALLLLFGDDQVDVGPSRLTFLGFNINITDKNDTTAPDSVERLWRRIFQQLLPFQTVGFPKRRLTETSIVGDIVASWNREERCGVSIQRFYA